MRYFLSLITVALVCLGIIHLNEKAAISGVFSTSHGDMKKAAMLIHKSWEEQQQDCPFKNPQSKFSHLTSALLALEHFATSKLERTTESLLIKTLLFMGLPLPDLSLGDGQIKATSVRKVLSSQGTIKDRDAIAKALLQPCKNRHMAELIMRHSVGPRESEKKTFDRKAILKVAAHYNGQNPKSAAMARLSHAVYNELVYHLYHIFRFDSLMAPQAQPSLDLSSSA